VRTRTGLLICSSSSSFRGSSAAEGRRLVGECDRVRLLSRWLPARSRTTRAGEHLALVVLENPRRSSAARRAPARNRRPCTAACTTRRSVRFEGAAATTGRSRATCDPRGRLAVLELALLLRVRRVQYQWLPCFASRRSRLSSWFPRMHCAVPRSTQPRTRSMTRGCHGRGRTDLRRTRVADRRGAPRSRRSRAPRATRAGRRARRARRRGYRGGPSNSGATSGGESIHSRSHCPPGGNKRRDGIGRAPRATDGHAHGSDVGVMSRSGESGR